jgi:hypothetical protein
MSAPRFQVTSIFGRDTFIRVDTSTGELRAFTVWGPDSERRYRIVEIGRQ